MVDQQIVTFSGADASLSLQGVSLVIDVNDEKGIQIAARFLATDLGTVTGHTPDIMLYNKKKPKLILGNTIIIGSLQSSCLMQDLSREDKIDCHDIEGKWECFVTSVVEDPLPSCRRALTITGSDTRGTIFGIYTLSEQIGVSPWYWWADVAVLRRPQIFAKPVRTKQGPPSVKYRGIFINDEAPALTGWVLEKMGSCYNVAFYEKVFELLLRLKANFLWPAMWPGYPNPGSNFFVDDPLNQSTAHDFGIVVSTSHHEPMQRSMGEWFEHNPDGSWSWIHNKDKVQEYFKEGALRAQPYDSYLTMGMRGEWDKPMTSGDALEILKEVLECQREIIKNIYGKPDGVCQLLALYKEVQEQFEKGLEVPDDVTLLFADDNFGTIRRLPTKKESERGGRSGIYYHLEYVGAPRSYKWINSNTCGKIWQQLQQAFSRGADQIWVFNVGDIKPLELPLTFALRLAWDVTSVSHDNFQSFFKSFAEGNFSADIVDEIANLLYQHDKLVALRKHEHIESNTFAFLNYREFETIVGRWRELYDKAQNLEIHLPQDHYHSFFQLVLHPIQASYIYNKLRLSQAKNQLYGMQRRNSTNTVAHEVLCLFDEDFNLSEEYHSLLGGRWNHMMRQPHYGYRDTWHAPSRDLIEGLCFVQTRQDSNPIVGSMGVAIESHAGIRPGLINEESERTHPSRRDLVPGLTLPPLQKYGQATRWFELFRCGTRAMEWSIKSPFRWLIVSPTFGRLNKKHEDVRITLSVDWSHCPADFSQIVQIEISSTAGGYEHVHLPVISQSAASDFTGFVESDGCVAIDAVHFARPSRSGNKAAHYQVLPFLGRSLAGSVTVTDNPESTTEWLEYHLYTFTTQPANAQLILFFNMTLDTNPETQLQYEVMLDSHQTGPLLLLEHPNEIGDLPPGWSAAVQDCIWKRVIKLDQSLFQTSCKHVLKVRMQQQNIILEKIILDLAGVRQSYLGPPESEFIVAVDTDPGK